MACLHVGHRREHLRPDGACDVQCHQTRNDHHHQRVPMAQRHLSGRYDIGNSDDHPPQAVSNVALGDGLDDEGYLAQTEEVIRNYHNAEDGRIQVAAHPHTTYSCSERLLLGCMELAERYDVGFAIHMLESVEDRHLSDAQFAEWGGIIGYFQAKGLLRERTLFFHCDQVNGREAEILAEAGVAISHNPQSNATYHGSVADVPTLRPPASRSASVPTCPPGTSSTTCTPRSSSMRPSPPTRKRSTNPGFRSSWQPSGVPGRNGSATRSARSKPASGRT